MRRRVILVCFAFLAAAQLVAQPAVVPPDQFFD
jgi:hypothetical protein